MINFDDQEKKLSKPPKEPLKTTSCNRETLRQSGQTQISQTLYHGQISYGLTILSNRPSRQSDQNFDKKDIPSSLAQFIITRMS